MAKKPIENKEVKDTKEVEKNKEGALKSVKNELKQVTWPKAKDILKYSIATVVFVLIFSWKGIPYSWYCRG